MSMRYRPLDDVESRHHDWEDFNSLFGEHTPIVDDIFNRGVRTDLDCYVPTRNNFEYTFCKEHLGLDRTSATHRIYFLKGQVGRGKSTFVDYCRHQVIPQIYGKNVITFFLDMEAFVTESIDEELAKRLIQTIEDRLVVSYYDGSSLKFKTDFIRYLHYKTTTERDIVEIYARELNLSNLIRFVDIMQLDKSLPSNGSNGGVLIILDNIDENASSVISRVASFVHQLINICNALCTKKAFTILVTVRDYNAESYYRTVKYPITDMRAVDVEELIRRRLRVLSDRLKASYKEKTKTLEYTITADTERFQARTVTITKNNLIPFLEDVIQSIFTSRDRKVMQLLENLAAGNLKMIIGNVFNLLYSCKLPLSDLFKKHFRIPELKEYQIAEPFKIDVVLECLLAVHQPFYCARESLIMNLFNCANSDAENDFHDVLIIPRILCFINNTPHPTVRVIKGKFNKYKYTPENIERALAKCFKYGLFETSYGVKLNQLDPRKSKIDLSIVGKTYMNHLMKEVTYYQYVCEDTYLPEGYIPIWHKYPNKRGDPGSKKLRLEGARQLIKFIKSQEKLELDFIKNQLKLDIDNYLANYSFRNRGRGITLAEFFEQNVDPSLKRLLKEATE
ncbi:MAG: hypothetical protein ACE5HI_11420 [bacterium]